MTDENKKDLETEVLDAKHQAWKDNPEFFKYYSAIKDTLQSAKRKCGVSLIEDVISIQRNIINMENYLREHKANSFISINSSVLYDHIKERKEEDYKAIEKEVAGDKSEENKNYKSNIIYYLKMKERHTILKAVGYLWGFFDNLA